jgi:hypothetical protein
MRKINKFYISFLVPSLDPITAKITSHTRSIPSVEKNLIFTIFSYEKLRNSEISNFQKVITD